VKKIAVYGTLRHGSYNNARFGLGEPEEILDAEGFRLGSGWLPYMERSEGDSCVVEIHTVSDEMFAALNRMEVGAGYTPEDISTELGKQEEITAWTHPIPENGFRIIKDFIKEGR